VVAFVHRFGSAVDPCPGKSRRAAPAQTTFEVRRGDTVVIAAGSAHSIRNRGWLPLRVLRTSTPASAHDDTELLEL
jgi:mannose-6-phosphate isomerase-like protein (cupin superfamily)